MIGSPPRLAPPQHPPGGNTKGASSWETSGVDRTHLSSCWGLGLEESFKTDYQDFPVSSTMILRSRFQKPSEVKIRKRQIRCGKNKQKKSTASRIPVDQETTRKYQNLKKSSSKCEDIAWLDIFTSNKLNNCAPVARNRIKKRCKNLVTMTQRSKNNFLLLGKNKKQLYLKVLNPNGKTTEGHMVEEDGMEVITGGAPDPRQLTEQDNQLFIMHNNQEDSVRFQCYKDQNYYLHVNKDSVDLCKMEETDGDTGKDFYFKEADLGSGKQQQKPQDRKRESQKR
ncbi:uncharacterized protein [Lepidochelys kempii]|uniref:uncharacterized protein isoform X3 n=1 Tax=Lepidochelys kempii TaxID=8472 RepID=UPI003C701C28